MNDETWPALKWIFLFTPVWKYAAIIITLASVAIFAHGWLARRRGDSAPWQQRVLILAALLLLTATSVEVCAAAYYYFSCAAIYAGRPSIWLGSEKAIADMMLSRAAIRLAIGIVGTSFCLALSLLFPKEKKK